MHGLFASLMSEMHLGNEMPAKSETSEVWPLHSFCIRTRGVDFSKPINSLSSHSAHFLPLLPLTKLPIHFLCSFFLIQRSSTPLLSNLLLAPASHRFTFPMQPLRCTNAKQGYRIHYVNTKEVVWGSETCGEVNETAQLMHLVSCYRIHCRLAPLTFTPDAPFFMCTFGAKKISVAVEAQMHLFLISETVATRRSNSKKSKK